LGSYPHLSAALTPTNETERLLGHYVAGHRRRLPPGQHPSIRAVESSAEIGIVLGPGETWVMPHISGMPEDAVLEFCWDFVVPTLKLG
jgi:hypothetical protein